MIREQMRCLFFSLLKDKTTKEVARIFSHERKFIYSILDGRSFIVDDRLIAGLASIGYEICLIKKNKKALTHEQTEKTHSCVLKGENTQS